VSSTRSTELLALVDLHPPPAARRPEKGDVDGEVRLEVDGSAGSSL